MRLTIHRRILGAHVLLKCDAAYMYIYDIGL